MKFLRTIAIGTSAAAVGLGMAAGTATAAVTPAASSCTTEPSWTAAARVTGTPVQDRVYKLVLDGGTFSAEWSSAWNLAVSYKKNSGTIAGTFEYFDIYTDVNNNNAYVTCGYGPGAYNFPAQNNPTHMFTGSAQPPKPYDGIVNSGGGTQEEVIAVMYIPSEHNYYGIDFTG